MAQQCTHASRSRAHNAARCAPPASRHFSRAIIAAPRRSLVSRLRAGEDSLVGVATDGNFEEEVLKSSQSVPVLVDFWASWCGPCKLVAPSMDWAAKEYGSALKVVKVDADPNPEVVDKYKVQGLPTLLLFKDGKKLDGSHWEGAITRKQLVQYLEKYSIVPVVKAA